MVVVVEEGMILIVVEEVTVGSEIVGNGSRGRDGGDNGNGVIVIGILMVVVVVIVVVLVMIVVAVLDSNNEVYVIQEAVTDLPTYSRCTIARSYSFPCLVAEAVDVVALHVALYCWCFVANFVLVVVVASLCCCRHDSRRRIRAVGRLFRFGLGDDRYDVARRCYLYNVICRRSGRSGVDYYVTCLNLD